MYLIMILVIIVSLIITSLFVRKQRVLLQKIKDMEETDHIPILGSAYLLIGKPPEEVFKEVMSQLSRIGSPCKSWKMTKLVVTVRFSDDIQRILSSPYCYEKGSVYEITSIKTGLVTAKPSIWRNHRKLLNSSFHISLLNNFVQEFNNVSRALVADLSFRADDVLFDIEPFLGYRIVDLQLKTIFDANIGETETRIISENNKMIFKYFADIGLKFYTHIISTYIMKLFKVERFEQKLLKNNFKYIKPFIDAANEKYEQSNIDNTETEDDVKNKPELFIHRVVKLVKKTLFTEEEMIDHINTMLLAGTDTLTVAISNCMLCLAMNPEAQNNCVKEITDVMGKNVEHISIDDLTKLDLLERTVKECLRLIPSVPLIARVNERDIELGNKHVIPAGTNILIPIVVVHLCKEYWGENSTTFDPNRFLPENIAKRPLLSYIPFSYGLRNCIARKYSFNALKIIIAHLVLNYKFTTDLTYEQLKLVFGATIILRNKYMVRIEKRQ